MNLSDIVNVLEHSMDTIDFVEPWSDFELGGYELDCLSSDKSRYYRAIRAYGLAFGGDKFCDLGTWWGLSACAAHKAFKEVDTFEIDVKQIKNVEALKRHCTLTIFTNPVDCLNIDFSKYSLVFVDVSAEAPYGDGEMELLVHEVLKKVYDGIALYDDIDLTKGTKWFWNEIDTPKLSLPDWHNATWHNPLIKPGFGIVDYRKGIK